MITIFRRLPRVSRFGVSGSAPSLASAGAPKLSVLGMRLGCWVDGQTSRHQSFGTNQHSGATDYELSLGKIVDTLTADYRAFFERNPDFDIYDDCVVFELGLGGEDGEARTPTVLKGKRAYRRALLTLQRLTTSTLRDGKVKCSAQHGSICGGDVRVNWTCTGEVAWFPMPVYISAISIYYISPQAHLGVAAPIPSHRIHRHTIEFLEIHPPSLRRLLPWWDLKVQVPQPTLAVHERHFESALELQVRSFEEGPCARHT